MEIAQNDASYKERGRGVEFLKFSKKKGGGGITYFHTNPFQLVFGVCFVYLHHFYQYLVFVFHKNIFLTSLWLWSYIIITSYNFWEDIVENKFHIQSKKQATEKTVGLGVGGDRKAGGGGLIGQNLKRWGRIGKC